METGDIIDVYVSKRCTRGACPVSRLQTVPNLHYLDVAKPSVTALVQEVVGQPAAYFRTTFKLRDINDFEMVFRTRRDRLLIHAMQTFASYVRKDVQDCRLLRDGERIDKKATPGSVSLSSYRQ